MKTIIPHFLSGLGLAVLIAGGIAQAETTAFTYQGRLNASGNPTNGVYDFRLSLFDSLAGPGQVGASQTNSAVLVSNGLFTVLADFGAAAFPGQDRWLEVAVRTNNTGSFVPLAPRQKLTPSPYAIHSSDAAVATTATGVAAGAITLAGLSSGSVDSSKILDGSITSSDLSSSLLGNTFWRLLGNAGTTPGVNFLGTTDSQAVEIRVNNNKIMSLAPDGNIVAGFGSASSVSSSVTISGGDGNSVLTASGSTIGGGVSNQIAGATPNPYGTIAGGWRNRVSDSPGGAVGGGEFNAVDEFSSDSVISGGRTNQIHRAPESTIAGGEGNLIIPNSSSSYYHSIGGGGHNSIISTGEGSTIAGGRRNTIDANSLSTSGETIGGGADNLVKGDFGTIAGGNNNTILGADSAVISGGSNNGVTNAALATISGGSGNSVTGPYGVVPGGSVNLATNFALAAGHRAKAAHTGAFVWADSADADFSSTTADQASFRCSGGVRFTSGGGGANQAVSWAPGAASWSFTSDRNTKEGIEAVEGKEVLKRVSRLPISEWNYTGFSQRHIGPMAQDFHALFPLNESDTTLNSADLDGVALAAIKGLNEVVEEKDTQIRELKHDVAELRALVQDLIRRRATDEQ